MQRSLVGAVWAQGLWELATRDRGYHVSFSIDALAALVCGLESGVLEVVAVAAAAVWVVTAKAEQRAALVQVRTQTWARTQGEVLPRVVWDGW